MLRNKIDYFKAFYKFASDRFCIEVIYFCLFIKNVFIQNKKLNFTPKYTRYRENAKKQNCLFQKYPQFRC